MASLNPTKYEPSCILAHRLINKLTVIIGGCDLLQEQAFDRSLECAQRLLSIRETAQSMADELKQHQCHLDSIRRGELLPECSTIVRH